MEKRHGKKRPEARQRPWWGPLALVALLIIHTGCAHSVPGAREEGPGARGYLSVAPGPASESEFEGAAVCAVELLEPRPGGTRPVPISREDFQRAFQRLAREVRLEGMTPQQAARELLESSLAPEEVEVLRMKGWWELETWRGKGYTLVPVEQSGLAPLSPAAEEELRNRYLRWCEPRGGGDCLGLFEDGPYLRTDDRRTLALAFAFGSVLDETREALARELLDYRALVGMLVWTVGLYLTLWLVPELASEHRC